MQGPLIHLGQTEAACSNRHRRTHRRSNRSAQAGRRGEAGAHHRRRAGAQHTGSARGRENKALTYTDLQRRPRTAGFTPQRIAVAPTRQAR